MAMNNRKHANSPSILKPSYQHRRQRNFLLLESENTFGITQCVLLLISLSLISTGIYYCSLSTYHLQENIFGEYEKGIKNWTLVGIAQFEKSGFSVAVVDDGEKFTPLTYNVKSDSFSDTISREKISNPGLTEYRNSNFVLEKFEDVTFPSITNAKDLNHIQTATLKISGNYNNEKTSSITLPSIPLIKVEVVSIKKLCAD